MDFRLGLAQRCWAHGAGRRLGRRWLLTLLFVEWQLFEMSYVLLGRAIWSGISSGKKSRID